MTEKPEPDLENEYIRWKDYASVLLLALTVLFAGPLFGAQRSLFAIISVGSGVVGIVSAVMWHALEYRWQLWGKPFFLLLASFCLGVQAVMLLFHLILLNSFCDVSFDPFFHGRLDNSRGNTVFFIRWSGHILSVCYLNRAKNGQFLFSTNKEPNE